MTILQLIFYCFSGLAILSSVMVVAAKNPVHSVLFLVLTFFGMAGVWILLNAEFLALILVLVYVGAVMTLFLFVVMMLNIDLQSTRSAWVRYFLFALLVTLLVMAALCLVIGMHSGGLLHIPILPAIPESNTADLGSVLYTEYSYPFEIAGVLLLTSIIAAITLSHRQPKNRQVQNVSEQMAVKKENRMKLIKKPEQPI